MKIKRRLSVSEDGFAEILGLYRKSFPTHEQRDEVSQKKAFEEDEYHFDSVYDEGTFVGMILYWETETFVYVEHFCISDQLRNKKYGQRILEELKKKEKTIILEIDPPEDEISKRRKNFYQRSGYVANEFPHVHPPYHKGVKGHQLVVMSYPEPLTEAAYNEFNQYLIHTVMGRIMKVEQFVMAYGVEQDRLRCLLPHGFTSLRPVLRINAEIRQDDSGETVYLEFNTAVEGFGKRGWLNVGYWHSDTSQLSYQRKGEAVTFATPFLTITYTGVGIEGGCPAEKDNEGCYLLGEEIEFRQTEEINCNKEFCDCEFAWSFTDADAYGASTGETLAALATPQEKQYERETFSPQNAAAIPSEQVLGSYKVIFER